ncbi:hypothetical protein FUA48_07595 [Flavobacterium alkalisoli]|uniref:Molecular chaperone n=1 Tax=Flavobacterium alkalisoli TaxID=2602769 RepID=A0A5B9FR42_9FLAO|nr:hypothetical protein [Flavobacterium alkalisoli]QEE49450.1 hypothetical protein FUA48_07595 [Flavobacterium alkalisoli]
MKNFLLVIVLFFISVNTAFSQAGISVTPGRLYYRTGKGNSVSQFVKITNPTEKELEIGASFSDWEYEESGKNQILDANTLKTSCSDWIQILPSSFLVIKPGETKQVEIILKVPQDANAEIPVHTSMIFFTQLNPGKTTDKNGASIQVTVRMGVKIYHSFQQENESIIEFVDFLSYADDDNNKVLELKIENQSKIWADGTIKWELFNNSTGKKTILKESEFYTLPGNIRSLKQVLPTDLPKGDYTVSAILTYGEKDVIKIAELEFSL